MVPSFEGAPYAARRLGEIAHDARENNQFCARWITDVGNPPIVSRAIYLQNNDAILGGIPASDATSGSTGVRVRFAHCPERVAIAKRGAARFVHSLGGRLPGVWSVCAHYRNPGPHVPHVTSSSDEQIALLFGGRRVFGCAAAITTCPTNAEILSEAAIGRGRVVITDYENRRPPFIRYEVGDDGVRGICPCGRTNLPALKEILGKVRGFLVHRNGNRIACVDLLVALRSAPGPRQHQVIQYGIEDFTAKLTADRNVGIAVGEALAEHFGYLADNLRTCHGEEIPRAENGKHYFAICRI